MKIIIGCFLLAFMACYYSNSYGQSVRSTIEGKVLTENKLPAEGATISLLKSRDSSIIKTTVIGKNGQFKFAVMLPGNYLILLSKIGYERSYNGPYYVETGQQKLTNDIVLVPANNQLNEVSVVSERPAVEVRPGKIILNVQSNIMASGSSAFDILKQAPGVRVDNNNAINIIGRQNALITIDGKATGLTGDDLIAILRTMQASTIDRIELITAGAAKDDASAGGIINIVLKKGKNIGTNVTFVGSAGYGRYYKSNAGIVFNDRTAKFNIFGNYFYQNNKTFHDFTVDRNIDFDNVLSNYHTDYNSVQKNQTNSFGIGTDYFLSAKHTIGFLVNGAVSNDDFVKADNLSIANQAVLDSTILTNSDLNRHISRVNYNINYNGKFNKSGETLTANVNYLTYNRSSNEYINNDFYDAAGNVYRQPELLENLSPSHIHNWLSKVDFSDPLTKTLKFEAGLKYSNAVSNNDLIFGPLVDGVYQSNPDISSHFVYSENINAAYVSFDNKFDKFDFTGGLRAEQTIAKGNSLTNEHIVNSNYTNLFPNVLLTYTKDDKNTFSLSYNRGIKRPNYEEVNPFLYYVDPYDYRAGNPALKPEYSNFIELSYNYDKEFITTLYAHIIGNADDFNFYEQNDSTKVNITTKKNLGDIYNYGVKFTALVNFTNWWNANFDVDAAYQRYVSYPENGDLNKGTQDIIFNTTQNFIFSKTLTGLISAVYESPTFYGVNEFKTNYHIDAGISKQLFEKRASIRLAATDIFNTQRDRSHTVYQNLDMSILNKTESQVVRLTFTYRFGKSMARAAAHHTGNEEEQSRTKSPN